MHSDKSLNPFALGGVVRGKQFAGRQDEIARLRRLALGGQHAYLFAPRRYGKTSLLREAFEPEHQGGRLILLWCDCLPVTHPEGLAARLAEPIVQAARAAKPIEWAKQAAGLFKRLRPSIMVGPDGVPGVTVEVGEAHPKAPPALEDALQAAGRLAARRRRPVVVVLDEFQQVSAWDEAQQTEAVLRTVIQHQPGVAYVFAGSQRHLLQRIFADRARPLFNLAAPFPIARLTLGELLPWLTERFGSSGHPLEAGAAEHIATLGAGHPWATQYLSHFVWEVAAGGRAPGVTERVRDGLERALHAGETIYSAEFAGLTGAQRQVLSAMAREPTGSPTAAHYLLRHRLPAKSTVSQAVGSLLERGALEEVEGVKLVSDPLFGQWLQRA